jgi:hypothetical protein
MKSNIIKFHLLILCLAIGGSLFAQEYKSYQWDSLPKLHQLNAADQQQPELVLKENHILEYVLVNNNFVCYKLLHKIIKVNSDEAIERNNRIYLPMAASAKIIVNKARVISARGEVKVLKNEDIKEGINEETKTTYQYFALEGVDKGSEIEYLMILERNADYHGEEALLQNEIPKRNLDYSIICPSNLIFKSKSYNGLPELKGSNALDGRKVLSIHVDTIPGLKEEPFAVYNPNLMQFVYKLDENKSTGQKNLVNYIEASQTIFELTHEQPDKSASKNLDKLLKQININGINLEEDKIRTIENYIKSNFVITEKGIHKDLSSILEYKSTDEVGITKLYAAIFDRLQITYKVVLTTNRYTQRFDPEFESYNFLESYLIYLPGINKYLSPSSIVHRLGVIPFGLTYNYGLFVKNVTLGDFTSGVGEISFIEPDSFARNRHNHLVKVDFSKSVGNPDLYYTVLYDGQYAQSVQPYYSYIPKERQEEMNNNLLKNIIKDGKFTDIQLENQGAEYLGVKPLIHQPLWNRLAISIYSK